MYFVSILIQQSKTLYTTELDALKKLSTKKSPDLSEDINWLYQVQYFKPSDPIKGILIIIIFLCDID
ncbi:hypothetical protein SAMN05421786_101426 [Chryseobacterium ureilyticum]|uniref:Uncharacterized protein n=1 Tax=Chryseobacterium ureilyticum TaxID=373668 RepID=A0A1N7KF74_9FLAO|nr:hypothetical protein SAMN05421786_101426 [Chryseobacterium ureilyticum]